MPAGDRPRPQLPLPDLDEILAHWDEDEDEDSPDLGSAGPPTAEQSVAREREELELAQQEADLENLKELTAGLRQDRRQRKSFAWAAFGLVSFWLWTNLVVLFLYGFGIRSFALPEIVLTGLVGSSTANVIGLFAIVMRHLFPGRSSRRRRRRRKSR